jgi:hypothetical protein
VIKQTCTCKPLEDTSVSYDVRKHLWICTGCPVHDPKDTSSALRHGPSHISLEPDPMKDYPIDYP